ncbi:MAG: FtsQ-type POTRA domain-containing protein [Ruminococcaceae bacterium]|nr:FtsQ-type POTRA domain-containing protein [Oscillospiraceae bacterium]
MTDSKKIQDNLKKREKNAKSRKIFGIFLASTIALFFIILAFTNLFNINRISVEGISETAPYNSEEIIAFLNIEQGTNLITYDSKSAKKSLLYEFPYIEKIEIKKKLPSTLRIIITENKGTLFVELGKDTFILSSNLRVLEIVKDSSDGKSGRAKLLSPSIKRCVCGEDLVFEKEDSMKVIKAITKPLEDYSMMEKITELDTRDKFNVTLMYDNRFKIIFGSFENAENKIKLLSQMMDSQIWTDSTGIIDISSGTEAAVKFTGNVNN